MSGMKDGFKRGTNHNYRTRMANAAAVQAAEIALSLNRAATVIYPEMSCATCGHLASEHDIDRAVLLPGQTPGGEGCIRDWSAETEGCGCPQFVVGKSAA